MGTIKPLITLTHQGSILAIQRLDKKIAILDATYTLNYYDDEFELKVRKCFLKEEEQARSFHKAFSFDDHFLIAPVMHDNKFLVYENGVHGMHLQKKFSWHESELESTSISPDDHLLVFDTMII